MIGLPYSVITYVLTICGSVTARRQSWKQILKIFWPAWEPCREATSEYSDSIFPLRVLRILTYQPCKYEGMGMHCVESVNRKAKCEGVHQIDLQTTYRYSAEPFISYMIGLPFSVITTSWLYAGITARRQSWKFLKFWKYFELHRSPVERQPVMYSDSKFPVRILRILTYQPCIYEGMGMHSVDTLVCQSWGKYRWIMETVRQNVLFCRGPSNG